MPLSRHRGPRQTTSEGWRPTRHGASRFTKHIDLLIDDSPENVSLVKRGLSVLADKCRR